MLTIDVLNYLHLPSQGDTSGTLYNCLNEISGEGKPYWIGGDYYPRGIYKYINSVWHYIGDSSYRYLTIGLGTKVDELDYSKNFLLGGM